MSEIDAALKTRFQHIIEQENWILPEHKPQKANVPLQGGGYNGFGIALIVSGVIILLCLGGTCYAKYRK